MQPIKQSWFTKFKNYFSSKHRKRLKSYLIDGKYKVVAAFELDGIVYYMYDNPLEMPAGRFWGHYSIHLEIEMKCDRQYLLDHTKSIEKILNPLPGKPINLTWIAQANINLRERLDLMPSEDAIYKFASVMFFDETESPYVYDQEYATVKIEKWKAAGGTLGFFCQTPLKEVIPVLTMPAKDMNTYLKVRNLIEETHRGLLLSVLSEE